MLFEIEYKRQLEAVKYDARDAAVVELILQTGLRLSGVARLQRADIELPIKITRPDLLRKEPGTWGTNLLGEWYGRGSSERCGAGELASYCLHTITSAGGLHSKAAVHRLVIVILAGLRPPN